MSDADNRRVCRRCGLAVLAHEFRAWTADDRHGYSDVCIKRLRDALDGRSADLAAALVVVRAARVLRVREWQVRRARRGYLLFRRCGGGDFAFAYAAAERELQDAKEARTVATMDLFAAIAAYVKEGVR